MLLGVLFYFYAEPYIALLMFAEMKNYNNRHSLIGFLIRQCIDLIARPVNQSCSTPGKVNNDKVPGSAIAQGVNSFIYGRAVYFSRG